MRKKVHKVKLMVIYMTLILLVACSSNQYSLNLEPNKNNIVPYSYQICNIELGNSVESYNAEISDVTMNM